MKDTGELCGPRTDRGYNQTTASGYPFWVLDPRPEYIRIEDIAAHLSRICRFGGALSAHHYERVNIYDGVWPLETYSTTIETYSVAQHSDLVSRNVEKEARNKGLPEKRVRLLSLEAHLHDAAEAYVGDVIKPIKLLLEPDWPFLYRTGERFGISLSVMEDFLYLASKAIPSFSRIEKRVDAAIRAKFGLPLEMSPEVKEADYRAVLTEKRDLLNDKGVVDWGIPDLPPFEERIVPVLPSVARAQFLQRFNELYEGEK